MTGRRGRLARLEVQAGQCEYLNRGRVPLALERLTWDELGALEEAVQAAGGSGLPHPHPWVSPPADLGAGVASCWAWARHMIGSGVGDVWRTPPPDAPAVFAAQAGRLEGAQVPEDRYAWAGWALMGALAAVMLEEGAGGRA